jgi:hypothetical protein
MAMLWGTYLAKGVSASSSPPCLAAELLKTAEQLEKESVGKGPDEARVDKILSYVENLFRQDGASPFSSKIAMGFLKVKLEAHPDRMARVVAYLLER